MKISIPTFKGIVPLADPRLLAPEIATEAVNCRFETGNLEPYRDLMNDNSQIEANASSIFLYRDPILEFWLSWAADVDVILSPVIDDDKNTVLWCGDGAYPRIGYNDRVTGNATPPNISYQLGVPAPTSPLLIAGVDNNEQDENATENDETRFYLYTYVTENGEEGPPSPVSGEVTILNPTTATVNLSIPVEQANNSNISHVRIYRTGTTLDSSDFYLVTTLTTGTSTYADNNVDTQSVTLTSTEYDMPPANLKGLVAMSNGIVAGFFDNTVCFCEPYLPYAWPVGYRQATDYRIVGTVAVGNSVIVTTEGNPYIFSGVSPDGITGIKLEEKQSCESKRSIVDMGDYAIYASPDGLVAASEQSTKLITEGVIRRDQWQKKYYPSTIHACHFDGKYIAFYNNAAGFIYDPRTQTLVDLDFYAQACFNDLKNDRLFLVVNDSLKVWDHKLAFTYQTMRWKKRFELNGKPLPTCIRVETDNTDDLTFKLWVDGVEKMNVSPASEVFWLPPLRGEYFEIEVSGTANVRGIVMADNKRDLQHG